MSLRALTIVFLLAFGTVTALTGYVTFSAARAATIALVDRRIAGMADAVLDEAPPGDAAAILRRIAVLARRRDSGDIGFELEAASGRRLGGNVVLARAIPPGFSTLRPGDRIAGLSAGRAQMRAAGGGLRLITVAETEPIDGDAAVRARGYALGFGAIVLVVAAGMAAFGLTVRRRIGELRTAAEAIIDGDLQRRLAVDPHGGAFAAQAVTFNRMLDRIAALMDDIRNVSSDVAHDLRTPLARLRSRLATLAARPPHVDLPHELEAALAQCDALMAMFAAILRISEVEGGDRRAAFRAIDVAALAGDVAETMAPVAMERGQTLRWQLAATAPVRGDPQLLSQALLNLVENALRHTPAGTTVTLSVEAPGGEVAVRVADDGPGIAPRDRALALRRFGRLDASRHEPGHGLGLPLVDAVARLHGGVLRLEDAAPGLLASIILPRRNDSHVTQPVRRA